MASEAQIRCQAVSRCSQAFAVLKRDAAASRFPAQSPFWMLLNVWLASHLTGKANTPKFVVAVGALAA